MKGVKHMTGRGKMKSSLCTHNKQGRHKQRFRDSLNYDCRESASEVFTLERNSRGKIENFKQIFEFMLHE